MKRTSCHIALCLCSQSRLKLPMPMQTAPFTSHSILANTSFRCCAQAVVFHLSVRLWKSCSSFSAVRSCTMSVGIDPTRALFMFPFPPLLRLPTERFESPWVITVQPSSVSTCWRFTRPRPPMLEILEFERRMWESSLMDHVFDLQAVSLTVNSCRDCLWPTRRTAPAHENFGGAIGSGA